MNQRVKIIYDEAKKLAPDEREELAELLIASVEDDPEVEKAWLDEAERRWNARSGAVKYPDLILEAMRRVW